MNEIIGRIAKSDTAEVRVTRQLWKMRPCIDIRLWYVPTGTDEFVPSRKGVTFDAEKLPELIAALTGAIT